MQSMTGFTKLRGQARLAAAFGWFAALGAVIFVATLLVPGSLVVCRWRQFRPHCFAIALPLLSLAVVGLRVPHHTNGGWLPIVLYVMLGCSGVVLGASSARLTIGWVAWIGVVSFAAFGVHTVTALPFLFAFLGLLSLGIAKLSSAEANKTRESCALLALSIGFTVTWLGVVWNERPGIGHSNSGSDHPNPTQPQSHPAVTPSTDLLPSQPPGHSARKPTAAKGNRCSS
jgi:hypothetical protein